VSNARGWASWARGLLTKDAAAAIAELRAVINAKREREERQTLYAWYGLLAELQSAAGAVDDAVTSIKQGLELAERTGGHRMPSTPPAWRQADFRHLGGSSTGRRVSQMMHRALCPHCCRGPQTDSRRTNHRLSPRRWD
jgi:hypothetical protein